MWEEQTYGRLGLTHKTMGRLEANWKVKARICCLQYFYILGMKWIYYVLEEILVFQTLEEWKLGVLGTILSLALLSISVFCDFELHCYLCA